MAEIKDLLLKFNNILNNGNAEKDVIVKIFERVLGKKIEREDVSFKSDKLFIKSDVYLKSEINLNKERLLKEIKKQGIDKIVLDIK
jgi:hypothetical protein